MMTDHEMHWAIKGVMREHCKCKGVGNKLACNWNCPCGNPVMSGVCEFCSGDYLSDLNAMQAAFESLSFAQKLEHTRQLITLINYREQVTGCLTNLANATAKQRAEAFCRTLFPERFKE